ncbi:amidohydrolase [Christiangramia fulva]|uniref:Amidohydrolase n=1 Tax=Christiangramia fulva TaxID=2126553 RepID=A0A2R3Z144_9FLAO|nr:amidohydrolase family protein [Christiangramia fulva]AVR43968.1 amidohydrolase [Christiangramia fulva]
MKKYLVFALAILILTACKDNTSEKAENPKEFDLLITNAKVVDVQNNKILQNQVIGITSDTIRFIDKMSESNSFKAKETFDAENKFVMPGLWDMHVHFRGGDSLIEENKDFLPLYLAFGVTTVRDAGGDMTPSVLDWRRKTAKGEIAGPRIFTSGPKLDGANPAWPGSISVTNKAEIKKALDSLQKLKVDYVKMYDGSLTPEIFYGIIEEAENRKMKTTGHMPMDANFLKAVDLGLDGTEHMYYVLKACSPVGDSLGNLGKGYGIINDLVKTYDEDLAASVFSTLNNQETTVTPTLHIGKTLGNILDTDHSKDKTLSYIGKGIQKTYNGRIESAKRARAAGSDIHSTTEEMFAAMIVPMQKAGVTLLAGSDAGPFNSFVYPGESLHAELQELVLAGLTPQQALITSVVNGPKFFDLERYYGSLEKGKVGDLLILDKNPLEKIENTRSIKFIIKNDKIYTPDELLKDL